MTSQAKQAQADPQDPIDSPRQLVDFILRGARPRDEWGVGIETEKLVVDRRTGEAASYERIRELLARLDGIGGWKGIFEQEHLVGLQGRRSSVTLEPGGQLELSGKFCCDIHCSWRDLNRYRQHIVAVGEELGLMFLGLGTHPFTRLENISWLPKGRYRIMSQYMLRTGDMGQRMMKQTAGTQINLDFVDATDCARKLRLSQRLSAVSYALFANSPLLDGRPSGFLSTRGEIWSRTDPDRCGLIEQLLSPTSGLDDFVNYALDVPLYFIERDRQYIDLTGSRFTFRQFLDSGLKAQRATLKDWNLHLSTLFPEVRLRPQIEVRSADSLPPRFTASVAALYKGLLYTEQALSGAESLLMQMDRTEFVDLYRRSWREGLKATFSGGTLGDMAADMVRLARESLQQQFAQAYSGADESHFLDPLLELISTSETLAEQLLKRWPQRPDEQLELLVSHCGYSTAD